MSTCSRIVPYAAEAEDSVIGTLLFNGNHIEWLSEILTAEMFYRRGNALVFGAVKSLYDEGKPADVITIAERLEKTGKLAEAGGINTLRSMADRVVSTSGLELHAMYVLDKYIARRMMETGQDMVKSALDESTDVLDNFVDAEKKMAVIGEVIAGKKGAVTLDSLLQSAYDRMFERMENYKKNIAAGVDTGLYRLNRITGGWHKGNLIVLAGRPAMGKTAIALHFAKAAARRDFHVLMFSPEMSTAELADRLVISETDIDSEQFRIGNVENEIRKVDEGIARLCGLPVVVDENAAVTAAHIRARVREQCRKRCDLVIIDYLNLIIPEGRKNRNRENDVSELTRALKMIAKESDVPVMALAQLSRKCEERASKMPELADLRESGSIEQDADLVLFCFRPAYYWSMENMRQEYAGKHNYGELIIAKNRHGRTGIVPFAHNDTISAIYDRNDAGLPQNPF